MKLVHVTVIAMMMSGNLVAQEVNLIGTMSQVIKEPLADIQKIGHSKKPVTSNIKEIKLLKIELSDKAQRTLASKAKNALVHANQFAPNASEQYGKYPSKIQLGMNDVPVFDQGTHGTCVTFAITAAVDAGLKKGDYISQLCQLQLGNYLAMHGYGLSGWDGSWGRYVLSQMDSFGIVSKEQESVRGCGGLFHYPTQGSDPESLMNLEEYHQISEPLDQDQGVWSPILDIYQAVNDRFDTNKTLADVKATLVKGDRVTFEVLLVDLDLGIEGAVGSKNAPNDSWVLTPEIARDVYLRPVFGGHEMVITGYDDQAVAIDDQGRTHIGLLTLRNSWGSRLGDHGDFYMSYDYFKLLVIEAQHIRAIHANDSDDAEEVSRVYGGRS